MPILAASPFRAPQLPDGTTVKRSAEPQPREYVSIYGKIDIQRYVYAPRKGQAIQFAAIDARLALPAGKFSYLLQDWDQGFAMEEPFGQVCKTVQKILGLDQHVDSLERMNREMAQTERPHPCHKRMRAMLDHIDVNGDEVDGRAAVFGWISDEMAARHAGSRKPIVCIMDGEESLWNMRDVFQEEVPTIDILDLLHVTPRLWDAAALFHPRESDAAKRFVRERLLRILHGQVGCVRGNSDCQRDRASLSVS